MQNRIQLTDLRNIKTNFFLNKFSKAYVDILNSTRDKYYILSGVAPINLNVLDTIVENIGAATWPP